MSKNPLANNTHTGFHDTAEQAKDAQKENIQKQRIKLICDDFLDPRPKVEKFLHKLVNNIDLIVCDPPFNIADKGKVTKSHGKLWSNAEAWGDVFEDNRAEDEYDEFIKKFLTRAFVLLKPGGSLITFIDDKYSGVFTRFAERINAERCEEIAKYNHTKKKGQKKKLQQPMGFAHKKNIHFVKINAVPKLRQYNYSSAAEIAVWLVKPRLSGSSKTKPEIFNYERSTKGLKVYSKEGEDLGVNIRAYHNTCATNVYFYNIGGTLKTTGHPTEKYIEQLVPLVKTHSNEGSIVMDPFMGGGNMAAVCQQLNRHFIGFEILPEWHQKAVLYLAEVIDGKSELAMKVKKRIRSKNDAPPNKCSYY